MTSANLLIVLIVGTVVGALVGLGLGGYFGNQLYLAILAGFLGTIIGGYARNFVMFGRREASAELRTPGLVIVYAVVASLAASAAALEIARESYLDDSPVWIGTLAGLFAAILMAMLMITYHTHPGEMPKLRR